MHKKNLNQIKIPDWLPLLLFCSAAALLSTLWGYNYSSGNAEEQLPFIYRALDPGFLSNDFFTNTFAQYGPRTFYSEFVAFFARFLSLAAALFLLTFIANLAVAFLSAKISRFFFPNSHTSQYLAAACVLTLKTFWLGYSNIIYRVFLEPEHLAMPLILLGFYLLLKRKPVFAAVSFGLSSLFHALLGLEAGWILLGLALLDVLIQKLRHKDTDLNLKFLLFACLILAGFSVGLLYPYTQQAAIPSNEFIHLVAYVRHPHHYLPSYFETWQWGQAGVYLLGFGVAFWLSLQRSEMLRRKRRYFYLIAGSIVLLCVGGYLFVEVWPSRIWVSAQMYRLPYLIKWFSLVLLGGWVGNIIDDPTKDESRFFGLIAGLALVTPVSLAFVTLAAWVRQVIMPRLKLPRWLLSDIVVLVLAAAAAVIYKPELRTWCVYLLLFAAILIIYVLHEKPIALLLSCLIPLAASSALLLFSTLLPPPSFLKYETPVFALYKTTGELAQVADFARANTPEDAVFFVPPRMGEFRYVARRAIVVDFSAFPFQDLSMQEWFRRIAACYGISDQLGFDSLPQLNETVYHLTDAELKTLSEKFGFDYAIVYDSTNTNDPVIFRTQALKLVQIP